MTNTWDNQFTMRKFSFASQFWIFQVLINLDLWWGGTSWQKHMTEQSWSPYHEPGNQSSMNQTLFSEDETTILSLKLQLLGLYMPGQSTNPSMRNRDVVNGRERRFITQPRACLEKRQRRHFNSSSVILGVQTWATSLSKQRIRGKKQKVCIVKQSKSQVCSSHQRLWQAV